MTVTGKATASFNGKVIAETDKWEVVEGNVYFPPSALESEFFTKNALTTVCPWKGTASYYNVVVDGKEEPGAAWYYPECKERAKHIEGYVAFYKSKVDIEADPSPEQEEKKQKVTEARVV